MEFTKLLLSPNHDIYLFRGASNEEMGIFGLFLTDEVVNDVSYYKEWFFDDKKKCIDGNIISLDKEDNYILLENMYSNEEIPTILKMTRQQFLKVLDDWEEIIKLKPKEVIIKHENDEFVIETKN